MVAASEWSDGKYRSWAFLYLKEHKEVVEYFARAREEELLRLKWENDELRKELASRDFTSLGASA